MCTRSRRALSSALRCARRLEDILLARPRTLGFNCRRRANLHPHAQWRCLLFLSDLTLVCRRTTLALHSFRHFALPLLPLCLQEHFLPTKTSTNNGAAAAHALAKTEHTIRLQCVDDLYSSSSFCLCFAASLATLGLLTGKPRVLILSALNLANLGPCLPALAP